MRPARFWTRRSEPVTKRQEIVCLLCPRRCVLGDGQVGACGARQAKDGTLFAMTYGKPCALHVDPVEKKPLFHFYPGEPILSLATIGCNLFCDFCQNWRISTARLASLADDETVEPKEIVRMAKKAGCRLIAFTYTEPTIYYEYMLAIGKLAKKSGMACVMVSNGYIEEEPLRELIPFLDAANIDLKGPASFYRRRCKVPDPEAVRRTIVALKGAGVHVEITTLLIPGENDAEEDIRKLVEWVADAVGRETPFHLSAFRPDYKLLGKEATQTKTLLRAREVARERLAFVYLGNVPGAENDTWCPECGARCIARPRYEGEILLKEGACPRCGRRLPGRFAPT